MSYKIVTNKILRKCSYKSHMAAFLSKFNPGEETDKALIKH